MCGIFGAVTRPGRFNRDDIERATLALRHRGPDSANVKRVGSSQHWEIWFGHTRLSIIDLSPAGNQPMMRAAHGGREASIVFNGEVYNHRALRSALADRLEFSSTSDTEVLLAGLMSKGAAFLSETNGMLALAYWNDSTQRLLLARDRLGKKPLYIYEAPEILLFASELKAFASLGVPLSENAEGWAYYHWLRHVPGYASIYNECRQLPAASWAELDLTARRMPAVRPQLFWDPLAACSRTFPGGYEDAIDELTCVLDDATKIRLHADVPVGVFLSGGVDSSIVAASVAAQHDGSTTAFIVKAAVPEFDESPVAQRIAERLGLDTHVIDLRVTDYWRQTDRVAFFYDEPCSPLSQLPVMAMAEAARKQVKVVLTGDGGDEVFVGYPWFGYPQRLFAYRKALDFIPGARRAAAMALQTPLGTTGLRAAVSLLGLNTDNLDVKSHIAEALLAADSPAELYDHFQQLWPRAGLAARDRSVLGTAGILRRARAAYPDYAWDAAASRTVPELLAALELVTSMRDEILVKVDRGTMAYGLEARSPLLDHRVVELGQSLPLDFKMRAGTFKRILRDLCARRVGEDVARLAKKGFGIPPPLDMPPGPSPDVRWARAFELAWRKRWSGADPADIGAARSA